MIEPGDVRTLRILREKEKWADLPVIVITAHAHDEFGSEDVKRINAFASGHRPRYTMEKPVTPEKLIKAICEILEVEAEESPVAASFYLAPTRVPRTFARMYTIAARLQSQEKRPFSCFHFQ
jgi:DNA-binding response OmpR family regulator